MRRFQRRSKSPPFVMVQKAMLWSDDWLDLSLSTMILWIYLKSTYNGTNPDGLELSYQQMKRVIAPATISRAFKELLEKGWVNKTKFGGLYRYRNKYRLTGKWSQLPG